MTDSSGHAESYDEVAQTSAATVIAGYSTSFGWATRLLGPPVRTHVRNIYALVRIADEIVDDPTSGLSVPERAEMLADLEAETLRVARSGRSANLVVHAFGLTARRFGIGEELIRPFFDSMRADLTRSEHDERSFATYVYGSAEVVGLMCLRVFVDGDDDYRRLAPGAARLGAAFQKVNFLRDLAADHDQLGRSYFPGVDVEHLTDAQRDSLLDDLDEDLAAAAAVIRQLPPSSRRAVRAAHDLFAALSRRIRRTPAAQLRRSRVRVGALEKATILARASLGGGA